MQLSSGGPKTGFFQGLMPFIVVYKQTHRNACIFECVVLCAIHCLQMLVGCGTFYRNSTTTTNNNIHLMSGVHNTCDQWQSLSYTLSIASTFDSTPIAEGIDRT